MPTLQELEAVARHGAPPAPQSSNPCLIQCDGYWVMDLTLSQTPAGTPAS